MTEDDSPGLGVDFVIDAGDSFGELVRLAATMETTEAKILADANRIEKATSGMVNLAGATASVSTFGNAATRELAAAAREIRSVEKAGEAMVRQLERQNASYGKTREELRSVRAEERALAAERTGNTDLASRIRAAEQALYDKEFAAARKSRIEIEALAEAKTAAANDAIAAAARDAQATREAALAHAMFEAAARKGAQALREQEAAQRALDRDREAQEMRAAAAAHTLFEQAARRGAQAMREQDAADRAAEAQRQSSINSANTYAQRLEAEAAAIGKTADQLRELEIARRAADADDAGLAGEAERIRAAGAAYANAQAAASALADEQRRLAEAEREAANASREAAAAQAAQDTILNSLRSSVDPLYASQQRLMRELENAARLYRQGAIGQEEYERSSAALAQRLDEVQRAQARQNAGTDEAVRGAKLGANDLTNIAFQIQDIIISLQGGQKPLTVLMQQGSQLGGIMMQTGASFGDMVRAIGGMIIVTRPTAAASAALAEAETARAAAHTAASSAGARAAIAAAELAVAEEAATRAGIADTAAQNALALARSEAAAATELAAAANRQLAASQAAATASSDAAAASATRSLAPWIRGLGAAAIPLGILGAGVFALNQSMNEDAGLKRYAQSLGLTNAEMKKLGDQSVTTGDMLAGLATTLGFSLDNVGTTVKGWIVSLGQFFGEVVKGIAAATYGLFVGSYRAIVETWKQWPAVLADLFVTAVNGAAKSIEWLANKSIDGLNALSPFEDKDHVNLGRMENRFAGAGAAAGEAWGRNLDGAVKEAVNGIDGFMGRWTANSQRAARTRLKKEADAIIADRTPKTDKHTEQLAREAEAVEAQIRNLYALADAYGVSGAAALIAEARVKAESAAIKKRADIEAMVDRQVRLAIAQRVSDAAKGTAAMREQAAAQEAVNAQVAAGLVPAARAAELVQSQVADLPLLAAIEAARTRGQTTEVARATKALDEQRAARDRLSTSERQAAFDVANAAGKDRLAELAEELRLVGATDMERTKALATIRATQEAEKFNPADRAKHIAQSVEVAEATEKVAAATREWNDALYAVADRWDLIARNVQNAATGMADAFGQVGQSIGDMASVYAGFHATEERLRAQRDAQLLTHAGNVQATERVNAQYALATATLQIGAFGDMTAAAKGFFSEKSKGYAALSIAEKAFRAVEFALSVRAIAQDAIETGSKIAKSVARTAVKATEAVVSAIAGLPFPLNLAAGAATIAALGSLGVSIAGSFGGGGKSAPEPSNTGTGSVLGDPAAQSASIKRSIDALKEVDTLTSTYAREMMGSLRSIDNQIGGLATILVRAGNINASAGVREGFQSDSTGKILSGIVTGGGLFSKIPVVGGIVGAVGSLIGSLFGSKTSVVGSGLFGKAQSVGNILGNGFDASYYSDIEKQKKFLGIKTGTSYSTQYSAADANLETQFTLILRQFNDAIAAAAGPLGASTSEIQARLSSFVVNIGKIDLKGLTGEQIQEKLSAIFGAAADGMAAAAFPGIERFQKVGEGAFETLVRVASTVEAVTASLDQLGLGARALGIDAQVAIAAQFDSLSAMTSAAASYFEAFYTKEEQAAAQTAQLSRVFDSLGLKMPATLAGFRQLVEAQDLTSSAGQATYATLLKLAPAFAELQSALLGAKSAADIASERQDLERRLLELQGNTAAIRALDLAKLDASNRAIQEQIYALQDAQEAAKAADELRKAWSSVGDSIMDEVKRIRGLNDVAGADNFAALQGQFNAANAAARAGDMDAAKSLPALSQALLGKAADVATSRQELLRIQAATAAALEATYGVVGAVSSAAKKQTPTEAVTGAAVSQGLVPPAAANDVLVSEIKSLKEEVVQLRTENNSGNAAIASNTGRTAKKLDDVTSASGGEAISVASAA